MAVRLIDIAEVAKVDVSIVSRVLSGKAKKARIGLERQKKIMRIAKELGYRPNSSAQAMRSGKFNTIILAQSKDTFKTYLPQSLLSSIYTNLEKNETHLFLSELPDATSAVPLSFKKMMADGVILNYTQNISESVCKVTEELQIPYIWLNRKSSKNCVYSNSFKAGQDITKKIIQAGHERILYLSTYFDHSHYSCIDRLAGYREEMKKAGLDSITAFPTEEIHHDFEKETAFVKQSLETHKPTCVLCYWSNAVPAVFHAARSLHLKLPDDLSLVTFTSECAVHYGQFATSMIEPDAELGKAAVEMILNKRDSGQECESVAKDFVFHDCRTLKAVETQRTAV